MQVVSARRCDRLNPATVQSAARALQTRLSYSRNAQRTVTIYLLITSMHTITGLHVYTYARGYLAGLVKVHAENNNKGLHCFQS